MKTFPLPAHFYKGETTTVAQQLLGCLLVHETELGITSGVIVETEAYLVDDPAGHSFVGKTARTEVLFGPSGMAYVYMIYGRYYCLNAVTGGLGNGEAVLIRAIEPTEGIALMQERRMIENIYKLCNGPGRLASAMGITLVQNGQSLAEGALTIHKGIGKSFEIGATTRIGISKNRDALLRYYVKDNLYISHR